MFRNAFRSQPMSRSERQLAMLREMGIRLWEPPIHAEALPAETGVAATPRGESLDSGDSLARTPIDQARPAGVSSPDRPQVRAAPGRNAIVPNGESRAPDALPLAAAASDRLDPNIENVARMDWPELRAAVASCTACKLCSGRKQTVFGVGHLRAHWMIVGEAPGEQEDQVGEPFVGKSGQLLDNMLRAVHLSRQPGPPEQQVYIANSVKCRPPGNRNPQPDELVKCEPYLIRQVELVRPRIILAMGRFAVQSLLRSSEPIGKLRGRVHDYHGVPLIVTYHPAYLLRSLEEKARAWDDLCLAVETVKACTTR